MLLPALAFATLTVAAVVFFAAEMWHAALTPDLPWLLRTGDFILDHGTLPAGDLFSWTAADKPVVLYQWLFTALLAALDRAVGVHGLFVAHIGLAAAIYLVAPLYGAVPRRVPPSLTLAVAVVVLAIATVDLALRPMIASSAMLLAQYVVVQALRRGRLSLWKATGFIVAIYAPWANLDNGFGLGLGSLALFLVGDLVERAGFYRFEPGDGAVEGWPLAPQHHMALVAAAIVASLLNPYGVGVYAHLVPVLAPSYLSEVSDALRSPDFHVAQFRWFLLLMAALAALLMRARRAFAAADLLHLVAFTLATLACARFVAWAVLFYGLILPRALHHVSVTWPAIRRNVRALLYETAGSVRRAAGLATVGALAGVAAWLAFSATLVPDPCIDVAPALAGYGARVPAGERPFVSPRIGSCAIAQTPSFKVFIDTRFEVYGEAITMDDFDTLRLLPRWKETLRRWQVDRLIVEKRWPLGQALAADPDFEILYEDAVAVIARPAR
jgi:hypothetical protein